MPIEDVIRIDNSKEELAQLLGDGFMNYQLNPEDFKEGLTVEEFWKQAGPGTFMLLIPSKKQPVNGASVHIVVLSHGTIRNVTPKLLKKRLVGVQRVTSSRMLN